MSTGDGRPLGQRIAAVREHARLSRRELGERAGVSHAYVGKLERGEVAHPSGAKLDALARALGWTNYHALLDSDELAPPAAPAAAPPPIEPWTAEKVRQWELMMAELREMLLRAEAQGATLRRLYLAVLERDRANGGHAAGALPSAK